MIPYFCALIFLGIPIAWVEWAMARHGGRRGLHSAPGVLGTIGGPLARRLGVIGVLIPLAVSFYYVFIESWCLAYTWYFLKGGIGIDVAAPIAEQGAASSAFYQAATGTAANGALLGGNLDMVAFWSLTFAANIWLVFRGISGGIEKFCQVAMPLMAVCAVIVLIRVLTLGTPDPSLPDQNVINGLGYMWNPDFSKLGDASTWLAAAGQIFFSLSIGFGILINYGSYLKKTDDVALSSLTSSATNELFEVGFGGLITLTASFVFLGVAGTTAAVATGSFSLGFATLPVVFAHMGALGNLVGAIFFFMLFLAAITSSISMYQPAVAFFQEALGLDRRRATTLTASLGVISGLLTLYYTENGGFWSTVDFWVGTFLIFVMAGIQVIFFGWVFGIEKGWDELHQGAQMRVPAIFKFIIKYVAPAYLLIVFIGFCVQSLGASVAAIAESVAAQVALGWIALVTIGLFVVARKAETRWRALGLDLDGTREDAQP
jgi:SNF family Na+-dependent transporter